MNSELPASPPSVASELARGAVLINAVVRTRFLAGVVAAPSEAIELVFEFVRGRLTGVFFGSLALGPGGTSFASAALTAWLFPSEFRTCSGVGGLEFGNIMAAVPKR